MVPAPGEIWILFFTKHIISSSGLFRCETVAAAAPVHGLDKPSASYLSHAMLPRSGAGPLWTYVLILWWAMVWTSENSLRENPILQCVDGRRHLEKQARKEGGAGKTLPSFTQSRQEAHSNTTGGKAETKLIAFSQSRAQCQLHDKNCVVHSQYSYARKKEENFITEG